MCLAVSLVDPLHLYCCVLLHANTDEHHLIWLFNADPQIRNPELLLALQRF